MHDDGKGFDTPIIRKGKMMLFDTGAQYEMAERGVGVIAKYPKDEKIEKLIKWYVENDGWHYVTP